jgi:hypothetical protein
MQFDKGRPILSTERKSFERSGWLAAAFLVALATGCSDAVDKFGDHFGVASSELKADNGLSANGLSANGLSANGLSANGLSANGLSASSFQTWFAGNVALADEVMKYVVRCALPAGQSLSFTYQGKTYTWSGTLGLTPNWAGGAAATLNEKQLISACLAAHVNVYHASVSIAVEGENANGVQLSIQANELTTYSFREAAFFGNVFGSGAVSYSCIDHPGQGSAVSSVRACTFVGTGDCTPIVTVGNCSSYCTLDGTGTYYKSCTYGGVTYKPLTTRILPADVYTCGDGVCQVSERCGTGLTPSNCADCGSCGHIVWGT